MFDRLPQNLCSPNGVQFPRAARLLLEQKGSTSHFTFKAHRTLCSIYLQTSLVFFFYDSEIRKKTSLRTRLAWLCVLLFVYQCSVCSKNACKRQLSWLLHQTNFCLTCRKHKNIYKTHTILTIMLLQKNHLEKSIFCLSHVCGKMDGRRNRCPTSAAVLWKINSLFHSRLIINRELRAISFAALMSSPFEEKMLVASLPLRFWRNIWYVCGAVIRAKCIIRQRRRCS